MYKCVIEVMVLEGSGSSCNYQYTSNNNLKCFTQSKLVLTIIYLGESLSDIPFLTGKVFIHSTERKLNLVMSNLWRYLNGIVVMMHWVLYLNLRIFLLIQ